MKTTAELQHEYLLKLLLCNKSMTVSQSLHRLCVLNQHIALMRISQRG
jgi:hypothetical protein